MDEMKNKKRESFSKEIDHVVVLCFGIAFLLIYTASAILLYVTEDDISKYYGKAIAMFVVYLALYIASSVLVTLRIGQLFVPLDRVAYALKREHRFAENGGNDIQSLAESLRAQSEHVDELSRELETTQSDLDDAFLVSKQNRYQQKEISQRLLKDLEQIQKHQEEIQISGYNLLRLLKNAMPLETAIRQQRDGLLEQMQQIEDGLPESERQHEDTVSDFTELSGTFELLGNMHQDAEELLDNIYNEMTSLQSLSTQVNLYAMNTALDISRAGSITMSAISALDEIKELTGKMNEKTDDVLLTLIRTRNALKLAMDQSGECREKGEECGKAFENSRSVLKEQREEIRSMLTSGNTLTEDVVKLGAALHEAGILAEKGDDGQTKTMADIERLQTDLQNLNGAEGAEE